MVGAKGGDLTKETEVGVMQPQAKECEAPLEAGKAKERVFALEPPGVAQPSDTLVFANDTHFRLLIPKPIRYCNKLVLCQAAKFVVICHSSVKPVHSPRLILTP